MAVTVGLLLNTGCSSDPAQTGALAPDGAQAADRVTIRLIAFRPQVLRVPAGTRVTWAQTDPGVHTVTSGVVEATPGGVVAEPDGRFDSGSLGEGRTFSVVLDQSGVYPYFCAIHPSTMRGQLEIR